MSQPRYTDAVRLSNLAKARLRHAANGTVRTCVNANCRHVFVKVDKEYDGHCSSTCRNNSRNKLFIRPKA